MHIATSRKIGERCREWAATYYHMQPMDDCDIFISVLYDKIIPEEYIKSRPCFNFHPGILPWYRGAGAYSWAIINGEFETGVTLHEIDKDIDHGPVIDIRRFPILTDDTAETLFHKAEDLIFIMFKAWLHRLVGGHYKAHPQQEGRTYYRKDLERARDLTRYRRAFQFEGKPHAFYLSDGKMIYLDQ